MAETTLKNVLVIGSGGREHAICWKLSKSSRVQQVFCLPGSPGISLTPKTSCVTDIKVNDFKAIVNWCKTNKISLVAIGPEDPLAKGLGDELQNAGILCFGPSQKGAEIEANKDWAKQFMIRHDIPTAEYKSFTDPKEAKKFIRTAPFEALVVKASGLAAGKGVIVAETKDEACAAVDEILGDKKFGDAGNVVVVEEKLSGEEVSVLAFVDENTVKVMLPAQDHKRIGDGDIGGNTGGMGAYCPCPLISNAELEVVASDVLQKAVDGLRKEGIKYNGVLYAGMMLTPKGLKTLEFNCRFGDPETQVILPLLENDLYEVFEATVKNRLSNIELKFKQDVYAVGVVMASKGYPETSTKGCIIEGLSNPIERSDIITFHSGVGQNAEGKFVTNGGRVLINVCIADSIKEAAEEATQFCRLMPFEGAQFRTDIARKAYQKSSLSYKSSGVDIDEGERLVQCIKPLVSGTRIKRPGVVGDIGSFGGLFRINEVKYKDLNGQLTSYHDPVLVQGTDGVGTKLKLAETLKQWDTIGIDLVAMCANDVLCAGAEPFAFLDYIACGKLEVPIATTIVKGITEGCREVCAALVGGETAEMPSMYEAGKYDLAGYCVGVVEYDNMLPRLSSIIEGDILIGLPSSGLHSNGFSLVNKLIKTHDINLHAKAPFSTRGLTYGQEFLTPTKLYVTDVLPLIQQQVVKAAAHITGGGLPLNLNRVIPEHLTAKIDGRQFIIPKIFGWIAALGNVAATEMLRTFNCGVVLVLVVDENDKRWERLKACGASKIGHIAKRRSGDPQVVVHHFDEELRKVASQFQIAGDSNANQISYRDSGVDIDAGDEAVQRIKAFAKSTDRLGVMGSLGGFGGCFRLKDYQKEKKISLYDPVLVLGTDGVGTKLRIAQQLNVHDTVGIDLVAMCVNDILCNGAEPLTFLDYYACGKLNVNTMVNVVQGISEGCRQSRSALLGGETAEMPGMYQGDTYDLAGFSLGIVDAVDILPRVNNVQVGDILIALPSSGVHSNGFSLIRKVMEQQNINFSDRSPFADKTFGQELLTPTRIYVNAVTPLLEKKLVKALAHITGGGITENIPRVLPKDLTIEINARSFHIPPIFGWLAAKGNISDDDMLRTFNCGVGMVLIVKPELEKTVLGLLAGEGASVIGQVVPLVTEQKVIVRHFTSCLHRVQRTVFSCKKRVAVLISGTGSNLQALIDATHNSAMGLGAEIVFVISNKADVLGLERAANANIPSKVVKHKDYPTREQFDEAMSTELEQRGIDFICLAGFMRILTPGFVRKWRGKLLNIHPALLPKYPGTHAPRQALAAKDTISGCTVHFVDEGVDTGAIILQEVVPILSDDTEETLSARIHKAEHVAFPKALRLIATGAVSLNDQGNVEWH